MNRNVGQHHEVFYKFAPYGGSPEEGYEVDFLGCKIRHEFWPSSLRTGIPQKGYPPFDEEYFEWIDLLESVVQARDEYTMVELGAGFGRWMARAGVAMRQWTNLPCHFLGVEAEPLHFNWIPLHFQDNGIDPGGHRFVRAAVSGRPGHSHFYVGMPSIANETATEWYGQQLINSHEVAATTDVSEYLGHPVITHQSGYKTIRVRTVSLSEVLQSLTKVDLLDLDIQGQELTVISAAITDVTAKVKRIHIGTHSPEVESGLRQVLGGSQWQCVADYPCSSTNSTPWGPITFQDGVQSWINHSY
jgi:FkbM family methyltransferase